MRTEEIHVDGGEYFRVCWRHTRSLSFVLYTWYTAVVCVHSSSDKIVLVVFFTGIFVLRIK